jgi:hypothetical protein
MNFSPKLRKDRAKVLKEIRVYADKRRSWHEPFALLPK